MLDKRKNKPTLVIFTSGTTGEPKGIVHDWNKLMSRYKTKRPALRTIAFFPLDHMGGINTMMHTLLNDGCLIVPQRRDPDYICRLIQDYKVELLPATPTFLKLLLAGEYYKKYNLKSLKLITYGAESMSQTVLDRLIKAFPDARFKQTYGLSEIGVLRTKSKGNSTWMQIGEHCRVVKGMLEIKIDTAMVGYLNAPSPFTSDGYFRTGDKVETSVDLNDQYYRIIGRESELINVAGSKVQPQEVEEVIMQLEGVEDVTVYGEKNYLLGQVVCAKVKGRTEGIKEHCRKYLEPYKVPVKITESNETGFKKKRS
jgi:acyl-CoA synthetase (AMP-forming)/AMP-acid ligase II